MADWSAHRQQSGSRKTASSIISFTPQPCVRSTTTPSLDRRRGRGTRTSDQRRDPPQVASAPALQVRRSLCAYRWHLLPATPSFPLAVRSPLHQQVDHSREPFGIDPPVQYNAVTVRELDLDPLQDPLGRP